MTRCQHSLCFGGCLVLWQELGLGVRTLEVSCAILPKSCDLSEP